MSITTYSELQAAVASRLARNDLATQIPDFITLFEAACRKLWVRPKALLPAVRGILPMPPGPGRPGSIILRLKHRARLRRTIPEDLQSMPQDDSPTTSTADLSSPDTWSEDRVVGEADHALSPGELDALGAETTARGVVPVPDREIAPSTGQVVGTRDRRRGHLVDTVIQLSDGLTPDQRTRVLGHELGHVIEELAGRISTKGLNRELAQVYNTLDTGTMRTRNLTGPQHLGYRDDEIPREFIAEAIRAYMADPS